MIKISILLVSLIVSQLALAENNNEQQTPKQSEKTTTDKNTKSKADAPKGFNKKLARKIVKEAEALRSVDKAQSQVTLTSHYNKATTTYEMDIYRAPNLKAYIEFTAPDYEKGRRMLAYGRKYWSKFPDSKNIVMISRKEAIGNSAFDIGDLFQIDADNEYEPTALVRTTQNDKPCVKISLIKKSDDAPYHKIEYFVEQRRSSDKKYSYYPIVAHFFSESGKHLKTMTVEESKVLAGIMRPSKLKMVDNITEGKYSYWTTNTLDLKDLPNRMFTEAYLKGR